MTHITRNGGWVAVLLAAPVHLSALPGSPAPAIKCIASSDQNTVVLKNHLLLMVTAVPESPFDSNRVLYQLPPGAATSVVQQTNKSLCTQAGQAYHNAVAPGTPQVSRTVAVFKIGTTRYVVMDPAEPYGEFHYVIVFDAAFVKLRAFTG